MYVADGAGSGTWTEAAGTVTQGFWDYNDLTTASTPIALTTPGTDYELTNDGAGASTLLTYALDGLPNIWDVATDRFVFTAGSVLALGDTVDFRLDVALTTTNVNTALTVALEIDPAGSPYLIPLIPFSNFKSAGTYDIIRWMGLYMGNTATLNGGARLIAQADTAGATIQVNGWYIRALHSN